jgi:hypothetical protein
MSAKGLQFHFNTVFWDVVKFNTACSDVVKNAQEGKFSVANATHEAEKLSSAFKQIREEIEVTKLFFANGDELKEGAEQHFFKLTDFDARIQKRFIGAMEYLGKIDPTIQKITTDVLGSKETETMTHAIVYYDGPGDLFIRGEGARIRLPAANSTSFSKQFDYGESVALSWDQGLPLTREADHLWKATLVTKNGETPKYKLLIGDCVWSEGNNYETNHARTSLHVPSFDPSSTSLIIPMDVGFGNKLVLCGQGEVQIQKQRFDLNWEQGIDFQNFGPNLWVLPLTAKGDVEFKICLAKENGELVWENSPNRKLLAGQEAVLAPDFGKGVGRLESLETASRNLGMHLLEQQELVQNERKEQTKHSRAQVKTRAVPCLLNNNAKSFPDRAIHRVFDPVKIEEKVIDGTAFQFYFTKNDRAIIIQEAPEGCTAGASAMLIVDNGGVPQAADLLNRQAASYQEIAQDITNAGLVPLSVPVASYGRSLAKLREQILDHGPAYVRIKEHDGAVGHAILVDEIHEDLSKVRIRDPWHAWECVVDGEAFKKAWYCSLDQAEADDYTVQVRNGR